MRNNLTLRIGVDVVLFMCCFWFPWWVVAILALLPLIYFTHYYEIVVLGIILDSLYNAPVPTFHHIQVVCSFSALVVLGITLYIKEQVRIHR